MLRADGLIRLQIVNESVLPAQRGSNQFELFMMRPKGVDCLPRGERRRRRLQSGHADR